MPATETQRNEARARQIFESAQAGIIVNLGVTAKDAAQILLTLAASRLTPAAIKAALKK